MRNADSSARPTSTKVVPNKGAAPPRVRLHRPRDVAARLSIGTSTLRLWSTEIASALGPAARKVPGASHTEHQRRYSAADVRLLERMAEMLRGGATYEQVRAALCPPIVESPTPLDWLPPDEPRVLHVHCIETVHQLRRELAKMEEMFSQTFEEREWLAQELRASQAQVSALRQQLDGIRSERDDLRVTVNNLYQQVEQLQAQLDAPVWKRLVR